MGRIDDERLERRLQENLARIPNPANRATLEGYLRERKANGAKGGTLMNEVAALGTLAAYLGAKTFRQAVKADLAGFVALRTVQRYWRARTVAGADAVTSKPKELSDVTLATRRVILKSFYRWLEGEGDEYPPKVRWIRINRPKVTLPTDTLLSPADLKAMLTAAEGNPHDQAVLAVLYESGLRAGELCSLRIRSVEFDQYGARITLPLGVPGLKTGSRQVRLIDSTEWLRRWVNQHPRRHDPKEPLFFGTGARNLDKPLTPGALYSLCKRVQKRAKLAKNIHPHIFRFTAATERARAGWNEPRMRAYFGWSKSSDEPSYYTNLAGGQFEDMILEERGLKKKGHESKAANPALLPLTCRACQAQQPPTAMFCSACNSPLVPEAEQLVSGRRDEDLRRLVLEAVNKTMYDMLQQFAPNQLVVPHMEPVEGLTGVEIEAGKADDRKVRARTVRAASS